MNKLYISNGQIHDNFMRQCNYFHINKGRCNVYKINIGKYKSMNLLCSTENKLC